MITALPTHPIGIFDSGIGGLTVARSVVDHLPKEDVIYFGDTAHLPYGDKSADTIRRYALQVTDILLSKQCKLILIACNSASTAAYELIKKHVGHRALVMNVVDPVVTVVSKYHAGSHLGLIGTPQTIQSNLYHQKIQALQHDIQLSSLATPLLASAIETEHTNQELIDRLLSEYLKHPTLQGIEGLILGCTHYPVIKAHINNFYDPRIHLIDSVDTIAHAIETRLKSHQLLNTTGQGSTKFLVSDYTLSFSRNAKLFFGNTIDLELHQ